MRRGRIHDFCFLTKTAYARLPVSACTSGSLDPSHVLLAIGLPHEIAHGSLRLTINEDNTQEDIDTILEKMPLIIQRLRDMSPLWEEKAAEVNK
jgi:cysteine desulfurase